MVRALYMIEINLEIDEDDDDIVIYDILDDLELWILIWTGAI